MFYHKKSKLIFGLLLLILISIFIQIINKKRYVCEKLEMEDIESKNTDGSCNQVQTLVNLLTQYNLLNSKLEQQNQEIQNLDQEIKSIQSNVAENKSQIAQINSGLQIFLSEAQTEPQTNNTNNVN